MLNEDTRSRVKSCYVVRNHELISTQLPDNFSLSLCRLLYILVDIKLIITCIERRADDASFFTIISAFVVMNTETDTT